MRATLWDYDFTAPNSTEARAGERSYPRRESWERIPSCISVAAFMRRHSESRARERAEAVQ